MQLKNTAGEGMSTAMTHVETPSASRIAASSDLLYQTCLSDSPILS